MSSSTAGGGCDWTKLPSDLLGSIAGRLYVPDYIRFGAVCTSWRSAAPPPNRGEGGVGPLSPRMPYVLTADCSALLNVADGSVQRIAPLPATHGKWCVGSRDGWVALLDEFSNVSLLNPLTRSQIHLPLITTLPFIEPVYRDGSLSAYRIHEHLLWGEDEDERTLELTIENFRHHSIRKVILSSDPALGMHTLLAIFNHIRLLFFIRPGEDKWSLFDTMFSFDDVICCQDGTFLALVGGDGEVFTLDFSCDPPRKSFLAQGFEDQKNCLVRLLVESTSGDLLQLCRFSPPRGQMFLLKSLLIMRLDPEQAFWSPLRSLGEESIFVGNNYSISVSAGDIPGLKCNCVYFTNDPWHFFTHDRLRDVGIYNVEDGSVDYYDLPWLQRRWPPSIWITPTPW